MNTWFSKGASAPPPHMTGLRFFTLELPTEEALAGVVGRLTDADLAVDRTGGTVAVRDPWGTRILLRPGASLDSEAAATAIGSE